MNILKLIAQLGLDGRGFKAGMKEASSYSRSIGKEISSNFTSAVAGAFGTAAIVAWVKGVVSAANNIKDLSAQYSATTDEVQRFGKASKEATGMDFQQGVGAQLLRLAEARDGAITGNDKLLATFNKYGVSLAELQDPQLRNIDLMKRLGAAMQNLSETDKADLTDLFGKSGQKILETLKALESQGPIELISKEQIEAIDRASEAVEELKRKAQAKSAAPIAATAGFLSNMLDRGVWKTIRGSKALFGVNRDKDAFLDDDQEKMARETYEKRGDSLGSGLVEDLINARMRGTPEEAASQREILMRYAVGSTSGGQGKINGFEVPKVDAKTPEKPKPIPEEITPQTQAKLNESRKQSEEKLAEAALKFRMSQIKSEFEQRKMLEDQLAKHVEAARKKRSLAEELSPVAAEKKLKEADEEDIAAFNIRTRLSEMKGVSGAKLSVDSLTAQGQLGGGRDIVSSGDKTAAEVKGLKPLLERSTKATEEMSAKLDKLKGTVVSL